MVLIGPLIPDLPTTRKLDIGTGQTSPATYVDPQQVVQRGIAMADALAQQEQLSRKSEPAEAKVSEFLRSRSYQRALHDAVAMIFDLQREIRELREHVGI